MSESPNRLISNLAVAARENPLAASLIAAGAVWLLAGPSTFSIVSAAAREASSGIAVAAAKSKATAQNLREAVSTGAENMTGRLTDSAETSRGLPPGPHEMTDLRNQAVSALTQALERQPLAIGILGVLVGGLVASAIAATPRERAMMGDSSQAARSDLRSRFEAAKPIIQKGASDLSKQTIDAATDLASGAKTSVVDAFEAGKEAMKGNLPKSREARA